MAIPNNIEDMEEPEISFSTRGMNLCRTTIWETA